MNQGHLQNNVTSLSKENCDNTKENKQIYENTLTICTSFAKKCQLQKVLKKGYIYIYEQLCHLRKDKHFKNEKLFSWMILLSLHHHLK